MKHLLLTCCLIAAFFSQAKAQVLQREFKMHITIILLNARTGDTKGINSNIDSLNVMMRRQIAYLGPYISNLQATDRMEKTAIKSKSDSKAIAAEAADAALISKMMAYQATDNTLYTAIQAMLNANTKRDDATLISDYNQFDATLSN